MVHKVEPCMQRASGPQTLQFQIADDSCVFRSCLPSLVRHVAPSQQLQQVGLPHSLILSYSLFISPPLPCPYPSRTLPHHLPPYLSYLSSSSSSSSLQKSSLLLTASGVRPPAPACLCSFKPECSSSTTAPDWLRHSCSQLVI